MRQLARRLVLLMGASIVVAGCLSPTLPLPPPVAPEVEKIGTGQYLLTGEIPRSGFVFILNKRDTSQGYLALTDKKYTLLVTALPKDPMQVWYQTNDEEVSDVVPFEIPDDPAPGAGGAPAIDGGTPGADGGPN